MSRIPEKISVPYLRSLKSTRKIVALTAYDFTQASIADQSDIDLLLVGDSLGCVVQGHETTIPVTLEDAIYHCRCVSRGVKRALLVGDLPFMSYQLSQEQALKSAAALLQQGGASAVKLEGGITVADKIKAIAECDIPVVGHIGLTPQSFHRMGGHRIQGKTHSTSKEPESGTWERIFADAKAVESAGAFAVVLEGVPEELATEITKAISIPTIGIGAGAECDGQILVWHDLLGLTPKSPKFAKRYLNLREEISTALNSYASEVRDEIFPSKSSTQIVNNSSKSVGEN